MTLRQRVAGVFNRRQLSLGWSVGWRFMLLMLPVRLLAEVVQIGGPENSPLGAVSVLLLLPIGGNVAFIPVAIPVALFGLNHIGKYVLRRRESVQVNGFIGWALYWRAALVTLAGLIAAGLLALPVVFLGRVLSDDREAPFVALGVVGVILLPALVLWAINAYGWALGRVKVRFGAVEGGVVDRAPVAPAAGRQDANPFFNLPPRATMKTLVPLAAAYAVGTSTWIVTRPLVESALMRGWTGGGDAAWLALTLLWAAVEGIAFAWIAHRVRGIWGLAAAVGAASLVTSLAAGATDRLLSDHQFASDLLSVPWLLQSFLWAAIVILGIVLGARLLGASFLGVSVGILGALLVNRWLLIPFVFRMMEGASLVHPGRFLSTGLQSLLDAAIFGALLAWALARKQEPLAVYSEIAR